MSRVFKLGATVAMGAAPGAPFPIYTDDYIGAAKLLKELEFDSMEVHIRTPKLVDGPKIFEACSEIGIEISSIGTGQAYGAEGLSITSPEKETRNRAIQRLKEQLDLGALFHCPIIIGSMRGMIGKDRTFDEVNSLMRESMKELCEHAEKLDGEIVIEAIDRFETDYLKTAQDVLDIIEQIDSDRVLVHLDTYHMNLEESDWRTPIQACRGKLGHVHLADNKRTYPGSGVIDFKPILTYLRDIGYDRSLTFECYPYPDGITALRRGKQYILGVMDCMTCNELVYHSQELWAFWMAVGWCL